MAHPTKYEPLRRHLAGLPAAVREVTLTFAELEAILGTPLPATAWGRKFWVNTSAAMGATMQARAWRVAGWRVAGHALRATPPTVTFVRAG